MDANQKNRKEMYDNVLNYLDSHSSTWSVIPIAAQIKVKFTGYISQINQLNTEKNQNDIVMGKNKSALKRVIAEKADILNDQVETFADITGDLALQAKMKASMSDFLRLKNIDLIENVSEVIVAFEANAETLTSDYGANQEQATDLKADIDVFREMNGLTATYRINTSVANKGLQEVFSEASDALDKMDKVLKIFKHRDKAFYAGYQSARVIIDK